MEWKAHLKSSSLESESRLDALNFFFAGLLRKPNCHLGVEKTKGSVKIYIRMSSMRQLITNEPQHLLLTLELTQWSKNYLARKNGFSRFLHSFIPFSRHWLRKKLDIFMQLSSSVLWVSFSCHWEPCKVCMQSTRFSHGFHEMWGHYNDDSTTWEDSHKATNSEDLFQRFTNESLTINYFK